MLQRSSVASINASARVYTDALLNIRHNGPSCRHVHLGAIQVLRNADGGGVGVSDFPEKSVTMV